MTQVINVITMVRGMLDEVKSFVFDNSDSEISVIEESKAVKLAEDYFIEKCQECLEYDSDEKDEYLDEGYFHSIYSDVEVFLTWSV